MTLEAQLRSLAAAGLLLGINHRKLSHICALLPDIIWPKKGHSLACRYPHSNSLSSSIRRKKRLARLAETAAEQAADMQVDDFTAWLRTTMPPDDAQKVDQLAENQPEVC